MPKQKVLIRKMDSQLDDCSVTYLELLIRKLGLREVLHKEVIELLGEKSCRRCRVSCNRRATLMRCLKQACTKLEAKILVLFAIHLDNKSELVTH